MAIYSHLVKKKDVVIDALLTCDAVPERDRSLRAKTGCTAKRAKRQEASPSTAHAFRWLPWHTPNRLACTCTHSEAGARSLPYKSEAWQEGFVSCIILHQAGSKQNVPHLLLHLCKRNRQNIFPRDKNQVRSAANARNHRRNAGAKATLGTVSLHAVSDALGHGKPDFDGVEPILCPNEREQMRTYGLSDTVGITKFLMPFQGMCSIHRSVFRI